MQYTAFTEALHGQPILHTETNVCMRLNSIFTSVLCTLLLAPDDIEIYVGRIPDLYL